MPGQKRFRVDELFGLKAYDASGELLGEVLAVGFDHDRFARRVGIARDGASVLRFVTTEAAYLEGHRLVLPAASDAEQRVSHRRPRL